MSETPDESMPTTIKPQRLNAFFPLLAQLKLNKPCSQYQAGAAPDTCEQWQAI